MTDRREGDRPASGVPARGYSWPPFEPGNQASLRHGAYSTLATGERAQGVADEIRTSLPFYSPADEPAVRLLAVSLVRVEFATRALDEVDEQLGGKALAPYMIDSHERLDRLRKDLRSWIATSVRLMAELGMTASSRVRLGVDVVLAQRAADDALDRLREEGRAIREAREGSA